MNTAVTIAFYRYCRYFMLDPFILAFCFLYHTWFTSLQKQIYSFAVQ